MSESTIEKQDPCPFCGAAPIFPEVKDVYGTCYEGGCEECGIATISIQIIDCFDYTQSPTRAEVSYSWDQKNVKYGDEFIQFARKEALRQWNTRHNEAK